MEEPAAKAVPAAKIPDATPRLSIPIIIPNPLFDGLFVTYDSGSISK
jgi:hypothetical protein